MPTLTIDREPHIRWASPAIRKQTQSTAYRLSAGPNPRAITNGTKKVERSASISLPDLPLNFQRTHS